MSGLSRQLDKLLEKPLPPGLYIISTPIGNLSDLSVRALATLAAADLVFCEDTRHSRKLFSAYGLHKNLHAYHDFSGQGDRARILAALEQKKSIALISDAGTPLLADPGFKLVRAAIERGFGVFPIPGASAVLSALVASGMPSDQFFFGGFLPAKEAARRKMLEATKAIAGTLIFFDTANRLEGTLELLKELFANRPVVVARELTKLHEEFLRGSASAILETVKRDPALGELVILIAPDEEGPVTEEAIKVALERAMMESSLREAVEEVSRGLGAGKKMVYNLALKLKRQEV